MNRVSTPLPPRRARARSASLRDLLFGFRLQEKTTMFIEAPLFIMEIGLLLYRERAMIMIPDRQVTIR
jgi:hypothetical protein